MEIDSYKKGVTDACASILEAILVFKIKDVSELLPALAYIEKEKGNVTIH